MKGIDLAAMRQCLQNWSLPRKNGEILKYIKYLRKLFVTKTDEAASSSLRHTTLKTHSVQDTEFKTHIVQDIAFKTQCLRHSI